MIAATLGWEDEDEIAMLNGRKKDCTEFVANFNSSQELMGSAKD
jgi:hypothetical protein